VPSGIPCYRIYPGYPPVSSPGNYAELLQLESVLRTGSVGSARFWLPGSGSSKIFGSTDPDPRGKISTKNYKNKLFYS